MIRIEKFLRQTTNLVSIMCLAALLWSCSSKPEDAIIGKWENIKNPGVIMEFFKDGTISVSSARREGGVGNYKFLDGERIKVEMEFQGNKITQILKVALSDGELSITEENGTVEKYRNPEDKRLAEIRQQLHETELANPREVIEQIRHYCEIYKRNEGHYPLDVAQLDKRFGIVKNEIKERWDFELVGVPKNLEQIKATSTAKMKDGAGKVVNYDVKSRSFSGYEPTREK